MQGQSMTTQDVLDQLKYATSEYLERLVTRATTILQERKVFVRSMPGDRK